MPRPSRDALSRMYGDSQAYLGTTKAAISDLDDKSSKVLRINVILFGLLSSILTLSARSGTPNPSSFPIASNLFFIGTGLLGVSTVLAIISFLKKDISAGITNLTDHLETRFSEEDYLERAIEAQEKAANANRRLLESAAFWFQKALGTLVAALGVLFSAAITVPLGSHIGFTGFVVSLLIGGVVTFKEFEEGEEVEDA